MAETSGTFFRAKLVLEEVQIVPGERGHGREYVGTVADVAVTAGDPGSAMIQIYQHAGHIKDWHQKSVAAAPVEEGADVSN